MLTKIIDVYCKERQAIETESRDNSMFRVSDAGKCRLMRYCKRQGKPFDASDAPPSVLRQMQAGIVLHDWVECIVGHAVPADPLKFQAEGTVEDEHRLGHFDLLFSAQGQTWLYDVKTVTSKKMYYIKEKGSVPKEHIFQICSYASMLAAMPDRHILAYVERDTMDIHEVDADFAHFGPIVRDDWSALIGAWEKQEEPTPNPQHWECNYCRYKGVCPHRS